MKNLKTLKVLIVGLGQIGGSIGYDLVADNIVAEVIGYDKNPDTLRKAAARDIIHRTADSLDKALGEADLIILSAPIRQIIAMLPQVCSSVGERSALFDMAGTKTVIAETLARCGRKINYIGGHPLAGNEKRGIEAAERHKFWNRVIALTPMEGFNDEGWFYTAMHLVTRLGAKPLVISAREHDRLIALTSHLPYAMALALVAMAGDRRIDDNRLRLLMAGSFQGATRVAASAPDLTLDMFLTNRENIAEGLDELIGHLSEIKNLIRSGDESGLSELIASVRRNYRSFRGHS